MNQKTERIVAIVGRPNVGKSALFNRLAGRRIAIVHDQPGVTRDRLSAPCKGCRFPLQIIDTGGIGAALEDGFAKQVKTEATIAIESSDLILFVVDVLDGLHPIDESVAAMLRKQGKPVILGLNKADDPKHDVLASADFAKLGFSNVASFSATHGRGITLLLHMIEDALEPGEESAESATGDGEENEPAVESGIRVAIVGRPNVGKSSLFNAILGSQRAIVSSVAGTTRDAVDCVHERDGKRYVLVDTAGIRRRSKVDTLVESFSVQRAERAIRRADIVALVYDAADGISAQERKIAGIIVEENKPCILVANKFDLYHPDAPKKARLEELEEDARRELFFLHYAPLAAVSAKDARHLAKVFSAIDKVKEASDRSLNTGALNRVLQEAIDHTPPPAIGGRRFKLFYATLTRDHRPRPIHAPNVVMFVNARKLLPPAYMRFLENEIRKRCPYTGLPVKFDVRERQQKET
jgi:GTP-binding protein